MAETPTPGAATPDIPSLPQPEPRIGRHGRPVPAETRRGGWMLNVAAEGAYESAVPFAQVVGQDDYVSRLSGRLARVFGIPRGSIEIGADGGAALYRTITGLNRYTWGFDLTGEQRVTRRLSLKMQARSAQSYARDNPELMLSGALPPLVMTRSDEGLATVRWEFLRSWRFGLDARGRRYSFGNQAAGGLGTTEAQPASPTAAPADTTPLLVLRDGWSVGGRASVEHEWSRRTALGVAVDDERTSSFGRTVDVLGFAATARLALLRSVDLRLEAGASRFQTVSVDASIDPSVDQTGALDQSGFTPTGLVGLAWTGGRHSLELSASRQVEQTYGLGAIGSMRSESLTYRLALGRSASFHLTGTDAHNTALDRSFDSRGRAVTVAFEFGLPGGVVTRLNYTYWDRVDPFLRWTSHTAGLGLSRRFDWR